MISTLLVHSVYCITGVAAVSAPLLAHHPRTITAMLLELDDKLLHCVCWLVDGPKRDEVEPFEIMDALSEYGGLLHVLSQARLMTGIAIEASKQQPGDEAARMRRHSRELWRAVTLCFLSPSAYAHRVAVILAEMAAIVETVRIQCDSLEEGV